MILPLEKQVSSLAPSKRLKELGVKQESLFYWVVEKYDDHSPLLKLYEYDKARHYDEKYSAYSVAELYQLHYEKFGTMDKTPVEVSGEDLADYIANLIISKYEKGAGTD